MWIVKKFYPREDHPRLFMKIRLQVTTSTYRQLHRRALALGSDIENQCQRQPGQELDTRILTTILGKN